MSSGRDRFKDRVEGRLTRRTRVITASAWTTAIKNKAPFIIEMISFEVWLINVQLPSTAVNFELS